MRRRLPAGVRMYTGDDFNYAELIAGDGIGEAETHRHSDALLGIFDAIAPAASAALAALSAGDSARFHADPRADGAAVAPHLQGADALLQDRRRVHGLAERPPGPFRDGRRPAEHAFAAAFRRAVPAGRCRRPDRAAGTGAAPDDAAAGAARRRCTGGAVMRDFGADHRWLSINTATVRKQRGQDWPLLQILDACAERGIRAISPWRDQVRPPGWPRPARRCKAPWSGIVGLLSRRHVHRSRCGRPRRPRATTTGVRSTRPASSAARLPGAGRRRPARRLVRQAGAQGPRCARASRSPTASPSCSTYARQRGMPLAIEPLHPMYAADRACVNTMEQALDICDAARSGAIGRARRRASTSTTSGGIRNCRRRSNAPGASACWPSTSATGCMPTTDLLNDRGMMGDGVDRYPPDPRLGRSPGFCRLQRGRDLLQRQLVAARRRRGHGYLHRAAPQLRLTSAVAGRCRSG